MTSSASNQPDNPTVVCISTYLIIFTIIFLYYGVRLMQLGFGGVSVDLLATVASFPNPDDKIRSTSMKVYLLYTFYALKNRLYDGLLSVM